MEAEFERVNERLIENFRAQTKVLEATLGQGLMITGEYAVEYERLADLIEADRVLLIAMLDEA